MFTLYRYNGITGEWVRVFSAKSAASLIACAGAGDWRITEMREVTVKEWRNEK